MSKTNMTNIHLLFDVVLQDGSLLLKLLLQAVEVRVAGADCCCTVEGWGTVSSRQLGRKMVLPCFFRVRVIRTLS